MMPLVLFIQTMLMLGAAGFIFIMVHHAKRLLRDYEKLLAEHEQLRKDFDTERELHDGILDEVVKVIPDEEARAELQGALTLGRLNADRKHAEDNQKKSTE